MDGRGRGAAGDLEADEAGREKVAALFCRVFVEHAEAMHAVDSGDGRTLFGQKLAAGSSQRTLWERLIGMTVKRKGRGRAV